MNKLLDNRLYMPTLNCYSGPSFSLSGNRYFSTSLAEITIELDNPEESGLVLAAEWYLNGVLIKGNNALAFSATLACGAYTIGARLLSAGGWSGVVLRPLDTCKAVVSMTIFGPNAIDEGSSADFDVIRTFSDGSSENITGEYTFQASGHGSFIGNIFTADKDDSSSDAYQIDISALRHGIVELQKAITVLNTTPVLTLTGPSLVEEGATATYGVLATYPNGSQVDISSQYAFSSEAGSFLGSVFTAPYNDADETTRKVGVTATRLSGVGTLNREITVSSLEGAAGILVVDLFNFASLDVIAWVDSPDAPYTPAYTGSNVVPAGSSAASAMVLASDFIPQDTLNWRFEFNIARLLNEQPGAAHFIFYIKGRGATVGGLSGAFVLKSLQAQMTLSGSPGSYLPSVSGGNDIGVGVTFSTQVTAGANGDYDPAVLPAILRLDYQVATRTLTYTTS